MNDDVKRVVEEGLGSVGRLRILRALASSEISSQTKYSLQRMTGLKPVDVRKHLKVLMDTGWVMEHDYNPPIYTLNLNNSKTKFLIDFFSKIDYL